jgi:sulfate adenylyltransferase subunit 1
MTDKLEIGRGDLIVKGYAGNGLPNVSSRFESVLCWIDENPLLNRKEYLLQHNSRIVECTVEKIIHKIDVNTLEEIDHPEEINLNDICRVLIKTSEPLIYDQYKKNKANGSFILIDKTSNTTAGAGMIC